MTFHLRRSLFAAFLGLAVTGMAAAAPLQRTLELHLTVEATQAWRNDPQWGKTDTQQRYDLSTQLQSDGRLYTENLLDPDKARRMRIKNDWYLLQGLLELKQENGGRLPAPGQLAAPVISAESMMMGGGADPSAAANMSPQRLTAMNAVNERPAAELDAFIKRYDAPGGRWLYFSGFSGCANQLHLVYRAHFVGDTGKTADKKVPFDMTWAADSRGSPADQGALCQRYVATLDPAAGVLYIENAYIPSARGNSARTHFGRTDKREMDFPVPYEVLRWTDEMLKSAKPAGKQSAELKITSALDGDSTVLGQFDGIAKVALDWSFK